MTQNKFNCEVCKDKEYIKVFNELNLYTLEKCDKCSIQNLRIKLEAEIQQIETLLRHQ